MPLLSTASGLRCKMHTEGVDGDDDGDYDYAPAASEGDDDDDGGYDYAPAA